MSYVYTFRNIGTNALVRVKARDARAAIEYVEKNLRGVFDCLGFADAATPDVTIQTYHPGEGYTE
jgi:hypothetical protein